MHAPAHRKHDLNGAQIGLRRGRVVGRAVLVLLLLPMLACVAWTFKTMPHSRLGARLDADRQLAIWTDYELGPRFHAANPFHSRGNVVQRLDLNTGQLSSSPGYQVASSDSINSKGECVRLGSRYSLKEAQQRKKAGLPLPPDERRFVYFKHIEIGAERMVEFDLPGDSIDLVKGRYYISADANAIRAVDLEDQQLQMFQLAAPYSGSNPVPGAVHATSWLTRFKSTNTVPPKEVLEVFELSERSIKLLATQELPMGIISRWDDRLAHFSSDLRRIELRAFDSLELVQTIDLPQEYLDKFTPVSLRANLLTVDAKDASTRVHFDLERWQALNLSPVRWEFVAFDGDHRHYCWFHGFGEAGKDPQTCLFDLENNRVLRVIPGRCSQERFVDENRFARVFDKFGVSVEVYNLQTGTVNTWRPFIIYAYLLPMLYFGFAAWGITWLVVSAREGGKSWFDLMILIGLPLVALSFSGATSDTPISMLWFGGPSQSYMTYWGITAALFALTSAWTIIAPVRARIAVIPLTVVLASFALIMLNGQNLRLRPELATNPFACAVGIALVAIVLFSGLRMRGFKAVNLGLEATRTKPSNWTLLDLFVMLTCSAIAIASVVPLFINDQKIILLASIQTIWWTTAIAAAVLSLCVLLTCLKQGQRWLIASGTTTALVVLVFVAQEVLNFAGEKSLFGMPLPNVAPQGLAAVTSAVSATFLASLTFRLRGWRLIRTN